MEILISLFIASLLSATLLPGGSEVLLLSYASQYEFHFLLWLVASVGNTLGSVINYILGRYFLHFSDRKWFPFKSETLDKHHQWFQRYGAWSMLFAWLPIIGDGLTFIAGILRLNPFVFVTLVFIGKGFRYAVLLGGLQIFFG